MNMLIIGCGKTGSQLCNELSRKGHDVSVIDSRASHFDFLSDDFTGYTVVGVPIDQDVLRNAGIEACDAVAALTENDNTNLMVCQLAREVFHVPRVLARIYDPRRSGVFRHFGMHTVCPTNLSVDAILSILADNNSVKTVQFDSASVAFEEVASKEPQWGKSLSDLVAENRGKAGLFGLLKPDGNLVLAYAGSTETVTEQDRLLYTRVID